MSSTHNSLTIIFYIALHRNTEKERQSLLLLFFSFVWMLLLPCNKYLLLYYLKNKVDKSKCVRISNGYQFIVFAFSYKEKKQTEEMMRQLCLHFQIYVASTNINDYCTTQGRVIYMESSESK